MSKKILTAAGLVALTVAAGACNREATVERRDAAADTAIVAQPDPAVELQKQRDQDLSKLDDRVAALERKYQEQSAKPRGTSGPGATAALRKETSSDMEDVKKAVNDLRTTTPENWWGRYETAFKSGLDDVESDVRHIAGTRTLPPAKSPKVVEDAAGQPVSTAPFTSSRDRFVADMRARIDAMHKSLDNVKATGPRKTELTDLKARVDKLGDDLSHLSDAKAEDWWKLSTARVNDYIERVEHSVARLDDHR